VKTLVLALGNSILTDDAVAFAVVEELRRRIDGADVTLTQASVGGLGLLDLVVGYERVIILDAIQTGLYEPGHIHRLTPEEFRGSLRAASTHDVSLPTALELGHRLHQDVPQEVVIIAIEAADVETFGEHLTPAVAAAVPDAVEMVLQELQADQRPAPRTG
jgi:hydrogenase maturation protease